MIRADLREQLELEALALDVTVNDVAGRILSEHFAVRFTPTGSKYTELKTRTKIRVSDTLHRRIRQEYARDHRKTVRGIVLSILAEHYELDPISAYRRPRTSA